MPPFFLYTMVYNLVRVRFFFARYLRCAVPFTSATALAG